MTSQEALGLGILAQRCPGVIPTGGGFPNKMAVESCNNRFGLHVVAKYQPGSRYWAFQGIETGIFVVLLAALLALSVWWVRRKVG